MPTDAPTAVIALGGNALAPAGEKSTIYDQFRHTRESLGPIVELARDGWNVCIVHGNGPQVGDELVRNEIARAEASPLPLGVLVAATAGWIGYMIQQSVENALRRAGSAREVVTIITQVEVRADDPALRDPSKFIGQTLSAERADELRREGHVVKVDGRGNLRRVVGSPAPQAIHELRVIKRGGWTLDQVKAEAERLFDGVEAARAQSPLPAEPDEHAANELLIDLHRRLLGV